MKHFFPLFRLLLLIAVVMPAGIIFPKGREVTPRLAQQGDIVFADNFAADPNMNGQWRIHRYASDTLNEASWDEQSQSLHLTRAVNDRAVALFANHELRVTSWEAEFKYKVGGGSGADGFTFMFYKNEAAYGEPGRGGFLGFQSYFGPGIDGYGIEFDSRINPPSDGIGDPSASHIALIQNTVGNHLAYANDSRIADNTWHTARIQFTEGHVVVLIDGQSVLDYLLQEPNYTYSGVGFSAATGLETDDHMIDDFVLRSNQTNPSLSSGLVAHYSFDDGTSADNSGHNHNGVIHGAPQVADGVIGKALKFDGVQDYIEVANSSDLNSSELTLSAWINPLDISQPVPGHKHYVAINKETQYEIAVLGQPQDSAQTNEVAFGLNPNWLWYGSNYLVELNKFIHIALTVDSSFKATFYVNGVKTRDIQYSSSIASTNSCLRIAARGCDGNYNLQPFAFFNGLVDDVRIYNRALNSTDIQALYQQNTSPLLDSDMDGIPDRWEEEGIDINGDGIIDLNLAALGAKKDRKDVFVEIDYMQEQKPKDISIQDVVHAFDMAPVGGDVVNGLSIQKGIALHVFVDEEVPTIKNILFENDGPGNIDSFNDIKLGSNNQSPNDINTLCGKETSAHFGTTPDREDANCTEIIKAKRMIFRYGVFAKSIFRCDSDSKQCLTGQSEIGGNDFVVTLSDLNNNSLTEFQQYGFRDIQRDLEASTFMHELGHTLGLRHGGDQDNNCKPNYISVMNYTYQTPLADPSRPLDYSNQQLPTLNEINLNEPEGIKGPKNRKVIFGVNGFIYAGVLGFHNNFINADQPVDWNGDRDTQDTDVSKDINYLNVAYFPQPLTDPESVEICPVSPGDTALTGFDDWSHLVYNFQGSKDYADGQRLDLPQEITTEQLVALALGVDADGDGIPNGLDSCPSDNLGCLPYSIYMPLIIK